MLRLFMRAFSNVIRFYWWKVDFNCIAEFVAGRISSWFVLEYFYMVNFRFQSPFWVKFFKQHNDRIMYKDNKSYVNR